MNEKGFTLIKILHLKQDDYRIALVSDLDFS